jgi:Predicted metal-dependent hydrolase of the TIM-barrel fold
MVGVFNGDADLTTSSYRQIVQHWKLVKGPLVEVRSKKKGKHMLDLPIVDSHVHLWDPAQLNVPWLAALPSLNRPFLRLTSYLSPEASRKFWEDNARRFYRFAVNTASDNR